MQVLVEKGVIPGSPKRREKRESIKASAHVFEAFDVKQVDSRAPPAPIGNTKVKRASLALESQLNGRPAPEELQSRGLLAADGELAADRVRSAKMELLKTLPLGSPPMNHPIRDSHWRDKPLSGDPSAFEYIGRCICMNAQI